MVPMIGGIVGGVLVLVLGLAGVGWWYIRRRRRARRMSWDRRDSAPRMVEGLEKGYAVDGETLQRDVEGAMLVIDLADIVETTSSSTSTSNSTTVGGTTLVDDRALYPAPRALPRATLAPATAPEPSRPSSIWTDDSEADAMAVDGSSYTRTLSTASSSTSTLHAIPLSPGAATGTYLSTRSMAREDELDHPGYTYVSTSSRVRPELFGIDTNATAISPATATTITNPFRDASSPITRPSPAHRLSPSPPYSAISPVGTWQSHAASLVGSREGSGSGSGSGHSTYTHPSYVTPPTTVTHSPISPTNGRGRRPSDPFADPPLYTAAISRESLRSVRTERSEIPPAYTALYGEDGLPRQ